MDPRDEIKNILMESLDDKESKRIVEALVDLFKDRTI